MQAAKVQSIDLEAARNSKATRVLLVLFSGIVFVLLPRVHPMANRETPTATAPGPKWSMAAVLKAVRPPAPEFPPLRVSGVVVNGARSTALINGVDVRIGGLISGVELRSVTASNITVRLGERTKQLTFQSDWMVGGGNQASAGR